MYDATHLVVDFNHPIVGLPGQNLTDAYRANFQNLFYFGKSLSVYIVFPTLVFLVYNIMAFVYQSIRQLLNSDPVGWMTQYISRNLD